MKTLKELQYIVPTIVAMPSWGKLALAVFVISGLVFLVSFISTTYRTNKTADLNAQKRSVALSQKDINRHIDDYESFVRPLMQRSREESNTLIRQFAARGTLRSSMYESAQSRRVREAEREIEGKITMVERAVEDIVFDQFHSRDIAEVPELKTEHERLSKIKAQKQGLIEQLKQMPKY